MHLNVAGCHITQDGKFSLCSREAKAIKPMDIRFFSLAPQLTDVYLESCDDGTSVFREIPLTIPSEVIEVELFDSGQVCQEYFLHLIRGMLNTTFYCELKKWGMEQWEKQAK